MRCSEQARRNTWRVASALLIALCGATPAWGQQLQQARITQVVNVVMLPATPGKLMVLEGVGRVWPIGHPELAVTVHAGEMVWLTAGGHISTPEKFDVKLVLETSLLITDFAPLPNLDLILQVIDTQQAATGSTPGPTPQKNSEDIISQRT